MTTRDQALALVDEARALAAGGLPPAGYEGSEQQVQDLAALERCERLNECRFCVWGEIDGARLQRANTSFHTARLAPEKTVSRPVLPLCSLPGAPGVHMKRLTYAEQLLHPNWQRMRLRVLEAAKFACVGCEATTKTLHVHHKKYVKGRMAWEYELEDFEALCKDCHGAVHEVKEMLDGVIAEFPSSMWPTLFSLLVGYGEEYVNSEHWLHVEELSARAGQVAWFVENLDSATAHEAVQLCQRLGPEGFMEALRDGVALPPDGSDVA